MYNLPLRQLPFDLREPCKGKLVFKSKFILVPDLVSNSLSINSEGEQLSRYFSKVISVSQHCFCLWKIHLWPKWLMCKLHVKCTFAHLLK